MISHMYSYVAQKKEREICLYNNAKEGWKMTNETRDKVLKTRDKVIETYQERWNKEDVIISRYRNIKHGKRSSDCYSN